MGIKYEASVGCFNGTIGYCNNGSRIIGLSLLSEILQKSINYIILNYQYI